ncbi:MAG: DnaJ C-terminal domain-containing protein [Maricaulaceae bacterium]
MAKDPYKLLGVTKDADEGGIRSAYRKLAKKYHPDVNSSAAAGEKFKEITAAYNLLSNPELKAQYDNGHVDANGQQNPFGGFGGTGRAQSPFAKAQMGGNFDDMGGILESLFGMQMGGGSPFGGRGQAAQRHSPKNGKNVRYRVKISFMEAWSGLSKTIKPKSGAAIKVKISAGTTSGDQLTVKGRGQAGQYGGTRGDAIIDISVGTHKLYRYDGVKTYLDLPVTLNEAVSGAKIKLKLPSGDLNVSLPKGDRLGQKLRLKGRGVKETDLIIQPVVQIDSLTVNALKGVKLPKKQNLSSDIRAELYN